MTSYTLNANDLPTQVSYSDGTTYTYTYDSHGDLLTSTDAGGTTTYAYDAAQDVTSISYPAGQSLSYRYDSKGASRRNPTRAVCSSPSLMMRIHDCQRSLTRRDIRWSSIPTTT